MAVLGIGADLDGFRQLIRRPHRPTGRESSARSTSQLAASHDLETQLRALGRSSTQTAAQLWAAYQPDYERYLAGHGAIGDLVKAGDTINGYTLLEDFRVVGAGLSEWTFAQRDGRPTSSNGSSAPPTPTTPRRAAPPPRTQTRPLRRVRGAPPRYPGRARPGHRLRRQPDHDPRLLPGRRQVLQGHREGRPRRARRGRRRRPDFPTKLVLLKTVAHSLRILHDLDIVHSDLKPSNVLVKKTELGYTTKLIDFDSSYIVGNPPPPDEIVGTMNYYSPELVRYIQGTASAQELTTASDIFPLGLLYAEYLTGALPAFDAAHQEAAVAVLNGTRLRLNAPGLPAPLLDLVERMLLADPAGRPTISQIHAQLMDLGVRARTAATPLRPPSNPRAPATALRGKGLRITRQRGTPPPAGDDHRPPTPNPPHSGTAPIGPSTTSPDGTKDPTTSASPTAAPDPVHPSSVNTLVGKLLTGLHRRRGR